MSPHDCYLDARAKAQADAKRDGFDRGLEWNPIFHSWSHRLLPGRDFRYGWETRCEVVMCERVDRAQRGHGPVGNRPRAWVPVGGPAKDCGCGRWLAVRGVLRSRGLSLHACSDCRAEVRHSWAQNGRLSRRTAQLPGD